VSDIERESERLALAVEAYLVARYPDMTLKQLGRRDIQYDDSRLAASLFNWRAAANWPDPHVIGERRCVDCECVMGDEPSACEDETVCENCAHAAASPTGSGTDA
jgi:hypothetical protein